MSFIGVYPIPLDRTKNIRKFVSCNLVTFRFSETLVRSHFILDFLVLTVAILLTLLCNGVSLSLFSITVSGQTSLTSQEPGDGQSATQVPPVILEQRERTPRRH